MNQTINLVQQIRRVALSPDGAGLTDGQLLACFIEQTEQAAFAALVRRHGPMVWSVCRRILGSHHDAQDAFQATFLVLVRKATSIVPREMVANWLHGVALHSALHARRTAARRKRREGQVSEVAEQQAKEADLFDELRPVLDLELSRLPDKYRIVILLCDLEGKSRKLAARELGCPEGTVAGRLARARAMLANRLRRHGLGLTGAALAAGIAQQGALASVPPAVIGSTIAAAASIVNGGSAGTSLISAKVTTLTDGVLKAMLLTKLKIASLLVPLAALACCAFGVLTHLALAGGQVPAPAAETPTRKLDSVDSKNRTDLEKMERKIAKEPVYQSKPKYALLAFGPEAKSRVWLVLDGDTLYVDRNGNGDLTEAGKKVAARASETPSPYPLFWAGDIPADGKLHKSLVLMLRDLASWEERVDGVKEFLTRHPKAPCYTLCLDVEVPGRTGKGIGGRVEQIVSGFDAKGVLSFGDSPSSAPIIHFDGPLQISLCGRENVSIGREHEVYLGVGTPGVGPGTTAFMGYEGIVPKEARPRATLIYPPKNPGESPLEQVIEFKERCCTYNFWDSVRVPNEAGVGRASIALSFENWKDGNVRPSQDHFEVTAPKFQLKIEPVSTRLKGALTHPDRAALLSNISYSPDGSKLLAGSYPEGVIQVWDVHAGKDLVKIETGYGYAASLRWFDVTPDWRTVFVSKGKRTPVRFEKNGQQMIQWKFDSHVRTWDLSTGILRETYQQTPAHGVRFMVLAPDGSTFETYEELPGESERGQQPKEGVTLWNVSTKQAHLLGDSLDLLGTYTPDGKTLAVPTARAKDSAGPSLRLIDPTTGAQKGSFALPPDSVFDRFSPDGKSVLAKVWEKGNTGRGWLKFLDFSTGRETASYPLDKSEGYYFRFFSPDGRFLIATNPPKLAKPKLLLIDLQTKQMKTIECPDATNMWVMAFSPDSKWLAVPAIALPKDAGSEPKAEDVPQPRIHLIETTTGIVSETIIAPQGFPASVCFSPDGKTLASAGNGRVLLWDMTRPPGDKLENTR